MKTHKIPAWILGLIIFSLVFLITAVVFNVFKIDDLPTQFFGALIGTVITAIITVLLLKGQTDNAEKLEKNVKIFERKQEVYHIFLDKIQDIVRDGEVTINAETDELKDLIFQLGYLQMHASENTMNQVLDQLSELIQSMNDFYSRPDTQKQKEMADFYAKFSQRLFTIVAALKRDLYGEDSHPVDEQKMSEILSNCGLFVQSAEINWNDLQIYFWAEIQKKLKERGYEFKEIDFTYDVNKYYTSFRPRHRWFGFEIPVYTTASGKKVALRIEVENNIFYGFRYYNVTNVQDAKDENLTRAVTESRTGYITSQWWAGWKHPDVGTINFWARTASSNFGDMKNPRFRDQAIEKIADCIDKDTKIFQTKAQEMGL